MASNRGRGPTRVDVGAGLAEPQGRLSAARQREGPFPPGPVCWLPWQRPRPLPPGPRLSILPARPPELLCLPMGLPTGLPVGL